MLLFTNTHLPCAARYGPIYEQELAEASWLAGDCSSRPWLLLTNFDTNEKGRPCLIFCLCWGHFFLLMIPQSHDPVDDDIRPSLSSSLAGSKTEASGFEIGSSASGTYLLAISTPASLTLQP